MLLTTYSLIFSWREAALWASQLLFFCSFYLIARQPRATIQPYTSHVRAFRCTNTLWTLPNCTNSTTLRTKPIKPPVMSRLYEFYLHPNGSSVSLQPLFLFSPLSLIRDHCWDTVFAASLTVFVSDLILCLKSSCQVDEAFYFTLTCKYIRSERIEKLWH